MQPDLAPVAVERRYRAVFVGLLVLVGILGGIGWLVLGGEPAGHDEGVAAAAPPAMLGPTSFAEVEPAAEPVASMTGTGADDEIQLCGGHWVKAGPDGKPAEEALRSAVRASYQEVSERAVKTMLASPIARVRAAAHYFEFARANLADAPAEETEAATRRHRDALARLAQATDDPQVYAWAYRACARSAAEAIGDCLQVSAPQWTRMDPDNAEPWLEVAEEARRRNDDAAFDDAMFHVAAAQRHHDGFGLLAATIVDHAPQDERYLLGTENMVDVASGVDLPPQWTAVKAYCSPSAVAEPNRRETCERVAGLLAERSTSLMARHIGEDLTERLGSSAERLGAISLRRDAELRATNLKWANPRKSDPMHCEGSRRTVESVRNVAEFGEVEMQRRDMVALGRPMAELAADTRRLRQSETRAAEQAASAASAPPVASATAVAQR